MRIAIKKNNEIARVFVCEDYEVLYKHGFDTLYIIQDGVKKEVACLGVFGDIDYSDTWTYEVIEK